MTLGRGVRRIVAGNAGMMTGPGTNTYLLGEREITVVDPGPVEAAHLHAILNSAGAPIRFILATHTHRDHSPLVEELAQRTGAQVIGLPPPATAAKMNLSSRTTCRATANPCHWATAKSRSFIRRAMHRIVSAICCRRSACCSPAITCCKACHR